VSDVGSDVALLVVVGSLPVDDVDVEVDDDVDEVVAVLSSPVDTAVVVATSPLLAVEPAPAESSFPP
jgi:hypothetical protein